MTIAEALAAFDALRPNMYTQAEKIAWLSECDGLIWHDVLAMRQRPPIPYPMPWPNPLDMRDVYRIPTTTTTNTTRTTTTTTTTEETTEDPPTVIETETTVETTVVSTVIDEVNAPDDQESERDPWTGEDDSVRAFDYFGVPLASDSRTLKIDNSGGYTGSITSVSFTGGTVEEDALIGRVILLNGVRATVTDNTENSISFDSTNFGTVADASVIYPGEIDPDKYQMLVPFPYDRDVYIYYLMMMNDQMNGETDKYNQSAKLFNTALLNYRNYVNRQRTPTRTPGTARFWW